MMNKKAVSPLVATGLLIIFAIVIGIVVMNLSKSYVEKIGVEQEETEEAPGECSPLLELQLRYVRGEITKEEYLGIKEILGTDK